jgi:hypothetical protein
MIREAGPGLCPAAINFGLLRLFKPMVSILVIARRLCETAN